ncbi:MAG: YciI family protein, partial [Pirellulaceae bacterium]
ATDGPFAETKEQLGGFAIIEADDLDHAVRIMAEVPCGRLGAGWKFVRFTRASPRATAGRLSRAASVSFPKTKRRQP